MSKRKLKTVEYLSSEEIINALNTLISSQGWVIVAEFLEEDRKRLELNIKDIEDDILDNKKLTDVELIRLQEKRFYQKELLKTSLLNIPQMIIDKILELKGQKPGKNIELDPYDPLTKAE
jgi:hypothetical protein